MTTNNYLEEFKNASEKLDDIYGEILDISDRAGVKISEKHLDNGALEIMAYMERLEFALKEKRRGLNEKSSTA